MSLMDIKKSIIQHKITINTIKLVVIWSAVLYYKQGLFYSLNNTYLWRFAMNPLSLIKQVPPVQSLLKTTGYRKLRHRITLATDPRESDQTYTLFLRVPHQFDALVNPVMDYILRDDPGKEIRIVVLGCATGAEAFSAAHALTSSRHSVNFSIDAYDISQEMIERCRRAVYSKDEIFTHAAITDKFVGELFDRYRDIYRVKSEIRQRVAFGIADVLSPALHSDLGDADIVFAQNLLFNLKPQLARKAFDNICKLLRPRSVLFIEGMDLQMRVQLTRKYRLKPLDFEIEIIHEDARRVRADGWPWRYWGLEPFSETGRHWKERYCTIFLKDDLGA